MKESDRQAFLRCPLFASVPPEKIPRLLGDMGREETFPAGSRPPLSPGVVGIVLSGKVVILGQGGTPLNRLETGGVFGVAGLFGEGKGAPTSLTAKCAARILFLSDREVEQLTEDRTVRRNLIAFLTDRIRFLNRKVATFSAPSAEDKLALYLLEREKDGVVALDRSLSDLARTLDLGRASLYRAFDALEERGAVRRRDKIIELPDRKVLEQYHFKSERRNSK